MVHWLWKYENYIYVNCSLRNEIESDLSSNEHYSSSSENKPRPTKLMVHWLWKYENYIYVNCSLRNEIESDLSSNEHYSSSSENKPREKFRPVRDSDQRLLRYRCSALATDSCNKLTGSWSVRYVKTTFKSRNGWKIRAKCSSRIE